MKKLIFLAVAFAALASPASADPVSAIAAWVGSTFAVGAATALAITQIGIGLAFSAVSSVLQRRQLGKQGGIDVQFDVKMGDTEPLTFTLGEYATAGKRKYIGSWGRNTRFITEVIEISSLPQGLAGLWVNDERGVFVAGQRAWIGGVDPSDDTTWFEGASVPSGSIDIGQPLTNMSDDGNRIVVKVIDGTQTVADPFLTAVFGADDDYPWTSAMIGRGKTYVIVTTRYDSDTLTQYPTFLWEPAPLPLYDWRFDSTNGGSGAQRWADRATHQPTRNPAVVAYNIARGIYWNTEWVYGGKNLSAWRLPIAEWTAAANACDQTVTLAGGGTQARYRCGLEVAVDMEPASVLEELGRSADMKFAEVGGRLKPIVDLPGAAVFSFTDADILITEGQSFSPFLPASDTYNAITATYPERGEKWTSKDAPEYIDTAAQASDGGQYLPTSMTYGAVPFARQVQRLMRSQMRDYRRMRRHQFYLPPDAYALEPGIDMVSWTSDRNGYINKQFMVESVSKTPGMNVLVSLREVDPSDYDWSSDFEQPVVITVPRNPRPFLQDANGFNVAPAVIVDEASNSRRPDVLATYTGEQAGVTNIQIRARVLGQTELTVDTLRRWNEAQAWRSFNVLPATAYEFQARLFSDLTPRNAWSAWMPVTTPDVGFTWEDWDEQLRQDIEADFEAARQAAVDAIAAGEAAQSVRNDHDALVDGFVGRLTDLTAADQGIQQRVDLLELSVNNSSYIRKTDGAAEDGSADIGQWTPMTGATVPDTGQSVPGGNTGRFIRVYAPGAYEPPYYSGATMRDVILRLRGWVYVDSGQTGRIAIIGSVTGAGGQTVLGQSDPITGGWQQVDVQFTVTSDTSEWAPAFLVTGGSMRFFRVRLEDYSAAASLEASISLNAQAILDEQSARVASVGVLTARADSLAARIFPSDMRNQAEYWKNALSGAPEASGPMAPAVVFGNHPDAGDYVRIPAGHSGNIHILSKAVSEFTPGKRLRFTVKVRTPNGATSKLRLLLASLDANWNVVRNSLGTLIPVATLPGGAWQTVIADYTLPAAQAGEVWFRAGVFSNATVTPDLTIDVSAIRIDDITASSDLVGEVSGEILDIKGLDINALTGTAFGVLLQQLQVNAGGTSALIAAQGSALADLEGNASAGYLIRAQAGSSVSLLDLIAADGSAGSVSVAKLAADDIILDGSVSARQLVIHDPANLIPDNQFQNNASWGLPAGPFLLVNSGPNFDSRGVVRFAKTGSGPGTTDWVLSRQFSVKANRRFHFEIRVSQISGTVNNVWLRVRWISATGVVTTRSLYAPGMVTGNHLGTATAVAPSDAQSAEIEFRVNKDQTDGDLNIGDILARALEMGSTLITPDGITSELVSADTMRALNGQFSSLDAANVRIGDAEIRRAMLVDAVINNAKIGDLAVSRIKIQDESVTTYPYAYSSGAMTISASQQNVWITLQTLTFSRGRGSPMPLDMRFDYAGGSTGGTIEFRLIRDGLPETIWTQSGFGGANGHARCVDATTVTGNVTYRLQAFRSGGSGDLFISQRFIGGLNAYK